MDIHHITTLLNAPLPGELAHLKLAPIDKIIRIKALKENPSPRLSAVCVLLYEKRGELHFVLTKRHVYDGVHSGQVSFPGGKKEDIDVDLTQTALRETEEEIGVSAHAVSVLGKLSEVYIPPSGFLVYPFVGFVANQNKFVPQEYEVNKILEVPISHLLDFDRQVFKEIQVAGVLKKVPCFELDGEVVWGATAMILSEFREILLRHRST